MKRIVLGLSVFLMFVQNGFARSDAELDKLISNESDKTGKQIYRCEKASNQSNMYTSNVNICLKAIRLVNEDIHKGYNSLRGYLPIGYINTGILYHYSKKDYLKAYEYYLKSANLGNSQAQENLDVLCGEHSWVCKR